MALMTPESFPNEIACLVSVNRLAEEKKLIILVGSSCKDWSNMV